MFSLWVYHGTNKFLSLVKLVTLVLAIDSLFLWYICVVLAIFYCFYSPCGDMTLHHGFPPYVFTLDDLRNFDDFFLRTTLIRFWLITRIWFSCLYATFNWETSNLAISFWSLDYVLRPFCRLMRFSIMHKELCIIQQHHYLTWKSRL